MRDINQEIPNEIRAYLESLLEDAQMTTLDETMREEIIVSFGLGYGNTLYSLVDAEYEGSTLKLAGSSINSAPLLYWEPLRKRIIELYR